MNEKFVLIIFGLCEEPLTPYLVPESEVQGLEARTKSAITDLQNAYQNSEENSEQKEAALDTLWYCLNNQWNQFEITPEKLKNITVPIKSVIITGASFKWNS